MFFLHYIYILFGNNIVKRVRRVRIKRAMAHFVNLAASDEKLIWRSTKYYFFILFSYIYPCQLSIVTTCLLVHAFIPNSKYFDHISFLVINHIHMCTYLNYQVPQCIRDQREYRCTRQSSDMIY